MSEYQKNYEEKKKRHLVKWETFIKEIANEYFSESLKVFDKEQIIAVLNRIGNCEAHNHTFMPSGGGLDLKGAYHSVENDKVELYFEGSPHIVNPTSLSLNVIGENPEWWYFRLNTSSFEPSGVYENKNVEIQDSELRYYGEEVLEVEPGEYYDRGYWDANHLGYDENGSMISLPRDARVITRKFNGGNYVIFPKYSLYNSTSSTYDARHNKMPEEEFREYIIKVVQGLKQNKIK